MLISRTAFLYKTILAFACGLLLIGCGATPAARPTAPALIPATGSGSLVQIRVTEYPLVEQSMDNPTHAGFQQRAAQAVAEQREAWHFSPTADSLQDPNQALADFGYRLEVNTHPPFSAYTLYHNNRVVQPDIARFWPVAVREKDGAQQRDFLLTFETLSGERLMASSGGVQVSPETIPEETSGGAALYPGLAAISGVIPADLNHETREAPGGARRWTAALDARALLSGLDVDPSAGYENVFHWQILRGQPFFFYVKEGQTYLHYAGSEQPFRYDQVVHASGDADGRFNPGSTASIVWFYALRDGLWYYVEVRAE